MNADERKSHDQALARERNRRYRGRHAERLRAANKVRRDATREQRRAYNVAYRASHRVEAQAYRQRQDKDEVRAYMKAYNEANQERLSLRKREWYLAHRDERLASARSHYESHKDDFKAYATKHKERIAKNSAARKAANRAHHTALQRNREAAQLMAMPTWANRPAIEAMYKAAKALSVETGIQYDVDHIVPLRGKRVCGLHVEYNLQIITHAENCRKHNTFPYEGVA